MSASSLSILNRMQSMELRIRGWLLQYIPQPRRLFLIFVLSLIASVWSICIYFDPHPLGLWLKDSTVRQDCNVIDKFSECLAGGAYVRIFYKTRTWNFVTSNQAEIANISLSRLGETSFPFGRFASSLDRFKYYSNSQVLSKYELLGFSYFKGHSFASHVNDKNFAFPIDGKGYNETMTNENIWIPLWPFVSLCLGIAVVSGWLWLRDYLRNHRRGFPMDEL